MAVQKERVLKTSGWLLPLAALACLASAQFLWGGYTTPYPPAGQIKGSRGIEDLAFVCLGLRRLGADINFIRLMQYYGSKENVKEDETAAGFYVYGLAPVPSSALEGGVYKDLYPMERHVLSLDPYFSFSAVYSAGALAFNLSRPDEAVALLEEARHYLPGELKYNTYLAAIGYSKLNDPGKVADELDPLMSDPQTPDMIRQLAAFLNVRIGRRGRAAEIYTLLLDSKEEWYARNARRQLAALRSSKGN